MLMDTMKFLNSAGEALHVDSSKYVGSALYDIAGSTISQPTDGAVLMRFSVNRPFTLPSGLTDSKAESTVAATGSASYPIKKNGVQVGTIDWAAAATDATFTFSSAESFVVGDILTVEAPATADAAHDGISWTFAATLD